MMGPPSLAVRRSESVSVESYRGGAAEWDGFVRRQEGWTHPHRYGWRGIIEDVHGHDTRYLAARDSEGRLTGVLPLVRVRSLVFGHYLMSMPFLNYGGPLGSERAVDELIARATEMAESEGADLLELRSRQALKTDMPVSHRKIAVTLDLPKDPEILWDGLDSKVRSQVRRPRKEGVEVRWGGDQVEPFFEVFSTHMRNLGTPTQPRDLFEAVRTTFGADAWFGCAYLDGKPIACGCGLVANDEVEMTWASDLFAYRKIAPNMLLYWSFMERAIEEGLSTFNFGRCTPGSGTHRFKKQWGTDDEKLWWYQWPQEGRESTPSPDEDRWSWGPKVWRKLPESVANAVGPRVVRYIP